MSTTILDEAIISAYRKHAVPADQLVADPELNAAFFHSVVAAFDGGEQVDVATVNRRLLNLRRRGEENGGLPRLQRDYRGRKIKPR
ncbi:MAG: hypothetical protein RIC55_20435 [Pirellulaceae bacterium]